MTDSVLDHADVFDTTGALRVVGAPGMSLDTVMAVMDVLKERHRQVTGEGWSAVRDDGYTHQQLAMAAACYALPTKVWWQPIRWFHRKGPYLVWPWSLAWWKPTTQRRDLVKACALLIAEIERLERLKRRPLPDYREDPWGFADI